ncbi:hypothetical protein NX819_01160 [Bacillus subtilis]|uniref:hypothetical protein n=1 Tax=Bacillus subtilis TaxID=1423 RepID=UPI001009C2B9|nr:hypothetical protein [Bacillus subtilis]RXM10795.1 hypothetical protein ETL41_14060 [Bacillus subtilis]UVW22122.1 hypothetical protein NX819_01160 [Bacillus subtilis]
MDKKQFEADYLKFYNENRIKLEPNVDPWLTCEAGTFRDCVKRKEVTYSIPEGYVRDEHFDFTTNVKKGNANVYWKDHNGKDGTIIIEVDANRPDGTAHASITGVYAIKL